MVHAIIKTGGLQAMRFDTLVNLDPKDPDARNVMLAVQQAAIALYDAIRQIHLRDQANVWFLLMSSHFDRVPHPAYTNEIFRTELNFRLQSSGLHQKTSVVFYHMRPNVYDMDENNWFLSSNGQNLDTPAEIFHKFLEECRTEDPNALPHCL